MEETLGSRLVRLREHLGLTQEQVAQKMQVTLRAYRRYEKGEQNPGADKLKHLVAELIDRNLNLTWLLLGEGQMFKGSSSNKSVSSQVMEALQNPTIEKMVLMLKDMEEEEITRAFAAVNERKEFVEIKREFMEIKTKMRQAG